MIVWLLLNPLVTCGVPILVAAAVWLFRRRLQEVMP